jgi:hypothetical protein
MDLADGRLEYTSEIFRGQWTLCVDVVSCNLVCHGRELNFQNSVVHSPDCTMALASPQYCVAPVVLQRFP